MVEHNCDVQRSMIYSVDITKCVYNNAASTGRFVVVLGTCIVVSLPKASGANQNDTRH